MFYHPIIIKLKKWNEKQLIGFCSCWLMPVLLAASVKFCLTLSCNFICAVGIWYKIHKSVESGRGARPTSFIF